MSIFLSEMRGGNLDGRAVPVVNMDERDQSERSACLVTIHDNLTPEYIFFRTATMRPSYSNICNSTNKP